MAALSLCRSGPFDLFDSIVDVWLLSSGAILLRRPLPAPAKGQSGEGRLVPHSAHAEIAHPNVRTTQQRLKRHCRSERSGHHRRHLNWRTRPASIGRPQGRRNQGRKGGRRQALGGRLSSGAPCHAWTGVAVLPQLPPDDPELRRGNRGASGGIRPPRIDVDDPAPPVPKKRIISRSRMRFAIVSSCRVWCGPVIFQPPWRRAAIGRFPRRTPVRAPGVSAAVSARAQNKNPPEAPRERRRRTAAPA